MMESGVAGQATHQPSDALALARRWLEGLNAGDRDALKAILAENATATEPLESGVITGPDAVVDNVLSYRNSFPDLHTEVTDGFGAGDRAVVAFTATGTYEPYTYGAEAKKVTWRGCALIKVSGEKVERIDIFMDWLIPAEEVGAFAFSPEPTNLTRFGSTAKK